jgi:hypothetical protein
MTKKTSVYCYLFSSGGCATSGGFSFLAEGTDGQYFEKLSVADASGTAALVGRLSLPNKIKVLTIRMILNGILKKRVPTPRLFAYDVPVDPSLGGIFFSLSGTSGNPKLTRPDGSTIIQTDK